MIRGGFLSLLALLVIFVDAVWAGQTGVIRTGQVVVAFEEPLRPVATEVAHMYPGVKADLEETFGWRLDFRPQILLIRERKTFTRMVGSDLFVAFAVPQRKVIVVDFSKMNTRPFTLRTTLKHELCHLLLHHHIRSVHLPKWLDEGVAQWVSGGVAEIIMDPKRSVLKEVTLSGNFIRMSGLTARFPEDERFLLLAYEQSKSFVEYINSEFGVKATLGILEHLRDGHEVDVAMVDVLSIPLDELERRWHGHLRTRTTWFTYLSTHLYAIVFFLGALLTIYGFIRVLIKKRRRYQDEEDDDALSE